ncbi:MAG TPA: hypothetical protein VH300_12745 [Thermoleophilaceae bacterium]|jgi:hypothetical protein|nr:hypothetical protein [Thermoleophilaceae bacterium]
MTTSTLAKGLALGRVAFGAAMLAKPEGVARGWIGRRAASYGGTQAVTRACGARDLSLGAGALGALASGEDARDWVLAGAFADAADLVATVTGEDIPLTGRLLIVGLAGAAIAVSVAYTADRSNASAQ